MVGQGSRGWRAAGAVGWRSPANHARSQCRAGYHVLCSHALTLLLLPLAATGLVSSARGFDLRGRRCGAGACARVPPPPPPARLCQGAAAVVLPGRGGGGGPATAQALAHARARAHLPPPPPPHTQLELANMYQAGDLGEMWAVARQAHLTFNALAFVLSCLVLVFVAASYVFTRSRPVYLLNFHVYKPPARWVGGFQRGGEGRATTSLVHRCAPFHTHTRPCGPPRRLPPPTSLACPPPPLSPCSLKVSYDHFMTCSRASKVRPRCWGAHGAGGGREWGGRGLLRREGVRRGRGAPACCSCVLLPPSPLSPARTHTHTHTHAHGQAFDEVALEFQEKVLLRSGLGEETYLPECE